MTDPMQRHPAGNRVSRKRQRAAEHDDRTAPSLLDHLSDVAEQVAAGQRRRDDGMRTAEHASHPWVKSAIDRAIAERAATRQPFVSDDIRAEIEILASSPGVLGARINAAARRGLIVKTGRYVQSRNASRHGGVVAEWIGTDGGDA